MAVSAPPPSKIPPPLSLGASTGPRRMVRACIYGDTGTMKTGSALTLRKCGPGVVISIGEECDNNAILDDMRDLIIEVRSTGRPDSICSQLRALFKSLRAQKPALNWIFFDSLTNFAKSLHDELLGTSERLSKPEWGVLAMRIMQILNEIYDGPWPIIVFTALEDIVNHTVQRRDPDGKTDDITVKIEGLPKLHGKAALKDFKPWKVNLIGRMKTPQRTATGRVSKVSFIPESGPGFSWLAKDQLGGKLGVEVADWYEIIKKAGYLPPGIK